MKIFFDTEFTGLHKNTTLVSIGMVAEDGREFYAELSDYDRLQVDDWIRDNVIANLNGSLPVTDKASLKIQLEEWLEPYKDEGIVFWSDCLAYDWVLFCDIWGGAMNLPKNIYYIPFDLSTLIKSAHLITSHYIDPDANREDLSGKLWGDGKKHNALHDARVIFQCFKQVLDTVSNGPFRDHESWKKNKRHSDQVLALDEVHKHLKEAESTVASMVSSGYRESGAGLGYFSGEQWYNRFDRIWGEMYREKKNPLTAEEFIAAAKKASGIE